MLLWWRLIRLWRQAWSTLPLVRHDGTEKTALTMSKGRRSLRWSGMLRRASQVGLYLGPSAHLQFVSQHADLSLIVLLHLELILLQLVYFVSNEFHLCNLLRHLAFHLLRGPALVVKLGSKRIHNLVQAMVWLARRRGPQVGVATMLSSIKHDGALRDQKDV
jgi:hypothetical protein